MALADAQIERYSRLVLLRGVGGRGQEALLSVGARLQASGPALLTAAAYLGAAGTPIEGPALALGEGDAGFLVRASELGQKAAPVLRAALEQLNADATRAPVRAGSLVALPDGCLGARPLVAVGRRGGRWVLWAANAEACAACLASAVEGAEAPGEGAEAIQAGALAALLFQRLVLGLGPSLSGMGMAADGRMEVLDVPECPHPRPVPASVLAEAVRHLEGCAPEEGCGVVLEGPRGMRWVPLRNAYGTWKEHDAEAFPRSPRTAFLFEPTEWLKLLREADAASERVAFIVHAHPEGPAAFSAEDRARAAPGGLPLFPDVGYLVVALREGLAEKVVQVRWQAGAFREWPLFLPS